jgi:hypothetical protein
MKNLLALCAAALLAACAHGKTADFPAAADRADAVQVYVIRNNNLFGWGLSVTVTLNEVAIAHLQAGEHIALRLPPGLYSVGITESSTSAAFEKGRQYYFLVSADYTPTGFEIESITAGRGEEWLSKTKLLP